MTGPRGIPLETLLELKKILEQNPPNNDANYQVQLAGVAALLVSFGVDADDALQAAKELVQPPPPP